MNDNTSTETVEAQRKAFCDLVIERSAELMQSSGAPIEMIIDRLLTYAAAQACFVNGSERTATIFHGLADNIARGIFQRVAGEGGRQH